MKRKTTHKTQTGNIKHKTQNTNTNKKYTTIKKTTHKKTNTHKTKIS